MRQLGWRGFWPFTWEPRATRRAFAALAAGGRPLVPPILQVSVLNRETEAVLAFAERVGSELDFIRIVPAHFDAPVPAGPREWRAAFGFLRPAGLRLPGTAPPTLPPADLRFLRDFDAALVAAGSIRPPAPPRG